MCKYEAKDWEFVDDVKCQEEVLLINSLFNVDRDTSNSTKLDEMIIIAQNLGFVECVSKTYDGVEEKVFAMKKNGLILYIKATTKEKNIDSAYMYGEIKCIGACFSPTQIRILNGCEKNYVTNGNILICYDACFKMVYRLKTILNAFVLENSWTLEDDSFNFISWCNKNQEDQQGFSIDELKLSSDISSIMWPDD